MTAAGKWKNATLMLGILVVGIGWFSHSKSTWVKKTCVSAVSSDACLKVYEECEIRESMGLMLKPCPAIEMERFFIAIIIICFVLSLGNLFMSSQSFKQMDMGYHVLAAVLLLIAGVLYIVSAIQINDATLSNKGDGFDFRGPEKLAAGALTILEAILYAITAGVIARAK